MKILFFILLAFSLNAQLLQPVSGNVNYTVNNGDIFYDSGGQSNYLNCPNTDDMCISTSTLCASGTIVLTFNKYKLFRSINTGDRLRILDKNIVLYDSNINNSLIEVSADSCIIVEFTTTSIGNDLGWEAIINVIIPVTISPPPLDEPCNYICKANVNITLPISNTDLIMNPTLGCNYDLMFTTLKGNPLTINQLQKGMRYIYKVGNQVNHCWGYINIL